MMARTQQERPIRVFAGGMNERMKNTLRFFFQGPYNNHCVLVEEDSADLGIIDLDEYQGRQHMQAYRERHPDQPIILLSLQNEEVEDAIYLRKPIKPERLISALKQAQTKVLPPAISTSEITPAPRTGTKAPFQNRAPAPVPSLMEKVPETVNSESDVRPPLSNQNNQVSVSTDTTESGTHKAAMYLNGQEAHSYIGSAPDLDLNDTQQLADAQYDPGEFIQGYLRRAVNTADKYTSAVKLKIPAGVIVIMPLTQSVLVNISNSRLRAFCTVPLIDGALSVAVIKKRLTIKKAKHTKVMSRESLLWKAAIWASRGRLPVGTSLTQPVFLRRWPNMTRLMLFPHAMRIAALWAEQPHSLLDTAKTLGIPQRFVFSFYSATKALGMVGVSRREADTLVEHTAIKKNWRRGLLGRILGHLRKFG